MCVLSIKVPIGKKSGNLSYSPLIYIYIYIYIFVYIYTYIFVYIYIYIYMTTLKQCVCVCVCGPFLMGIIKCDHPCSVNPAVSLLRGSQSPCASMHMKHLSAGSDPPSVHEWDMNRMWPYTRVPSIYTTPRYITSLLNDQRYVSTNKT